MIYMQNYIFIFQHILYIKRNIDKQIQLSILQNFWKSAKFSFGINYHIFICHSKEKNFFKYSLSQEPGNVTEAYFLVAVSYILFFLFFPPLSNLPCRPPQTQWEFSNFSTILNIKEILQLHPAHLSQITPNKPSQSKQRLFGRDLSSEPI